MCVPHQWVPDTAPGAVIKIENANQFAPVTCDPKELRNKFHEVCMTVYLFLGLAVPSDVDTRARLLTTMVAVC